MKDRIELLPKDRSFYKANLHCHSTVSDGAFTPEELKSMYMAKGYSVIAFTDHEICVPHTELTDDNFVALTGVEIAFGVGGKNKTSVHLCGIARDPEKTMEIPNEESDCAEAIASGVVRLRKENCISTLNHPLWSALSAETLQSLPSPDHMEVANGFEMIVDGYGTADALYEMELRRGRRFRPLATDDSHRSADGSAGLEYFRGWTVLCAQKLCYDAMIEALEKGHFYASTGPEIRGLWIENNVLYVETSPVCGIYVHGTEYRHRKAVTERHNTLCRAEIPLTGFETSDYLFVRLVDENGKTAWSCPYYFEKV